VNAFSLRGWGNLLVFYFASFSPGRVERKVPVIQNLCLQLTASMDWSLGRLEQILPPPLMLYLLQAYLQVCLTNSYRAALPVDFYIVCKNWDHKDFCFCIWSLV
jgi:hypothetical protein